MTDTSAIAAYWDAAAPAFDDEPDHGLRDGPTRRAWAALLRRSAPGGWARPVDDVRYALIARV